MKQNLLMVYYDGFPVYRTKRFGGLIETPHFDELIRKSRFYSNVSSTTSSTAMSLTSMFSGLFPHEFGRRSYSVDDESVGNLPANNRSLFMELEAMGYSTHVVWDNIMSKKNQKSRINVWEGNNTEFFNKNRFNNPFVKTMERKVFKEYGRIWELGRIMSYVKTLDSPWAAFVRFARDVSPSFVGASNNISNNQWDDEIFENDYSLKLLQEQLPENTRLIVTSDHGRMYGEQGIWGYAFNLCEGSLKVFITDYDPSSDYGGEVIDDLISLHNFKNIVLNKELRRTKYLYADTAYADQWHRVTMVRRDNWKYVYHRNGWPCKEQLFDLRCDPHEMINLAAEKYIDPYRDSRPKGDTVDKNYSPSALKYDGKPLSKVLPRNDWDRVYKILDELSEERKRIWALQNVDE
jgi:arylsulfatase A-like enzyme